MDATVGVREGTVLAGRYRVERQLGQGGMGAVYLVRHVRTEERLALKLLHASIASDGQALVRFRREAQAPARIDSDHVARVVDADVAPELGGAPFLVMEFLRGRDLGQELAARGRLAAADVVGYLGQAARALDKAHAMGIVHRDLKPENMFLAERDDGTATLKIVDFGIARLEAGGALTSTGQMVGTPLYMAPEQVTGQQARIGPRTDVWAIGLIAFRLLTGRHYWVSDSLPQLAMMVTTQPMAAPSTLDPSLSPAFDAWFLRCCARPVEHRFGSVGEAVAALGAALGAGAGAGTGASSGDAYAATMLAPAVSMKYPPAPPTPVQTPPPTPARQDGTRNAVLLVAGVLLLGFVAVAGAIALLANPFASRAPDGPRPTAAPAAPATMSPCQSACTRLAECTGISDPQCEANCRRSPALAACATREGCQAISSCALGAACPGRAPQGTVSCKATADCEGACLMRGGDPTDCLCACTHLMAPEHANELAANNECGSVRCAEACRKPVNGATCLRCFTTSCFAESMACKAK